jgi:FkbM family methyltransferase
MQGGVDGGKPSNPKTVFSGITNLVWRFQRLVFRTLHSQLRHSIHIKSGLFRVLYLLPDRWRIPDGVRTALKQFAATHERVFFINIGSNDGLAGNPLREFVVTRKWEGIMVEPVHFVYERLVKAYRGYPHVRCENVALGEISGTKPFYHLRKNKVLPPGYDQVGSFNKEKILNEDYMFPGLANFIESIDVQCLTLRDLLARHGNRKVDVCVIDAEGFDFEVIKQIDLKNSPPAMIVFETVHLTPTDKAACFSLLERGGYRLKEEGCNAVAKLAAD